MISHRGLAALRASFDQASANFAAGMILFSLVFGLSAARRVLSPVAIECMIALGVLIYAGTGLVTIVLGGKFLDYEVLDHHLLPGFLPHGQHLGIFLVEAGVGITVAAVMIGIFYAFAGRERAA